MKNPPSLADLTRDGAAAEYCKRHLSFFIKEFWEVIVPNDLVWNWHMDVLCDEIQLADERVFKRENKEYDVIFNVPPGTSKTKILSVLSTAWEFARMPDIKVFVGSYSHSAIKAIADEIGLVMKSDKYKRYFPETIIRRGFDTKLEFKTTKNGHFYAFTTGGTITSKHADILKVDDPLNPLQAASEAELEKTNFFFDKTLPTRKVDKKVTVTYLLMQRLADKDPTGHLLAQKGSVIRHICLPGEISSNKSPNVKPASLIENYVNGLLDPIRLDWTALTELKTKLGSDGYAGQIGQNPVPDGGSIWKEWLVVMPDYLFPSMSDMQHVGTDWDLAYTDDDNNAASAYITSGKIGNRMFIGDVGAVYLEFPELIKFMKSTKAPHYVEAKASGKSAKQTLVRLGIPAIEVEVEGGDKVARAKMASPYAEAGMVYIKASLVNFLYNDEKQGILRFPKGSHKDVADTLAQAIQRQFRGKIIVADTGSGNGEQSHLEALRNKIKKP